MTAKPPPPLTPRQERFIDEYLIDLNATQAAIRAGYAPQRADVQGARLLGNVRVAAEISRRREARARRTELHADAVVKALANIAFADLRRVATWSETSVTLISSTDLSDADAALVREIKMTEWGPTIKLHDPLRALHMLGQHLGLFRPAIPQGAGDNQDAEDAVPPDAYTAEELRELLRIQRAARTRCKGGKTH